MIQLENYNADTNYNLLEDDDIVNSLTSTATNKALSANQGKILGDFKNKIIASETAKQLWTGSASDWTNKINLGVNVFDYSRLYFVNDSTNIVTSLEIPKNYNFGGSGSKFLVMSWSSESNNPVPIYFNIDEVSGTTITLVAQRFQWKSVSTPNEVTRIYGVKRVGD